MNANQDETQEAARHNLSVVAGLQDLFQLLEQHGALLGRHNTLIAIDLNRTPSIVLDELNTIVGSILVAPSGALSIFGTCQTDETGYWIMRILPDLMDSNSQFSHFPGFDDLQTLLCSLPQMSKENQVVIEALTERLDARFGELMSQHGHEIMARVFDALGSVATEDPQNSGNKKLI